MTDDMKYDVFISVSEENLNEGIRLKKALESEKLTSWIYSSKTELGSWTEIIAKTILNSKYVFFIISKSFMKSKPCNIEIQYTITALLGENGPSGLSGMIIDNVELPDVTKIQLGAFELKMLRKVPTDEELQDISKNIANYLKTHSTLSKPRENSAKVTPGASSDPSPILTSWSPDGQFVTIRIVRNHPSLDSVRRSLVKLFGRGGGDDSWLARRSTYENIIVPEMEKICGKDCCPPL